MHHHRQIQIGSLAGAAYLLKDNAGVLRRAQADQKSAVDWQEKNSLDCSLQYWLQMLTHGLSILTRWLFQLEVSEKLPQG